jgi:hypothetical protein
MRKLFILFFTLPIQLFAQALGNFEPFESGDVIVYSVNVNGAVKKLEYTYSNVNANTATGKVVLGDVVKEFKSSGLGLVDSDFAASYNGDFLMNSPPNKIFENDIKVGHKWNSLYETRIDKVTIQVIQQVMVSKIEKVKLKIGEFDAALITHSDLYQGVNDKGEVFTGKSTASKYWIGVVNNRMLVLKREYQNSFGHKATLELSELPKVSDTQKRLEKLKDLNKQGLISDSEYELKRKELLKKL